MAARLAGALAMALLMGCILMQGARGAADEPLFTFVQVTDTHVIAGKSTEVVRRGIQEIGERQPPPAFVVLTGDLINGEAPEASTRMVKELFSALPCPVYAAYGNHDRREWHPKVWGEANYAFDRAPYHFIVLDNIDEASPEARDTYGGRFPERTVSWLREHLKTVRRKTPVVLFCHATIFQDRPYSKQLPGDAHNYEPVLKLLRRHHVVAWFAGHAHRNSLVRKDGVDYITTGGLSDHRQNADGPPGYRVVEVYRDRVATSFRALSSRP